jgi:hypothetical protein
MGSGAGGGGLRTALLALVVALSRVPFLGGGYGTDTDGWKLARAAREIATTGHYAPSRLPGFPLQEYVCALVWRGGPTALNGLSALFGTAAAALLYRAFRRLGLRDAWLAALAFAFVPAVYVGSVAAMDYLWAMAFLLAALNRALDGRAAAAGLMLGMATGARITTCVLVLPLALVVAGAGGGGRLRRALTLAGVAALVAAAWYTPVFLRFGTGFLSYYEPEGGQRPFSEFLHGLLVPGRPPFSPLLIAGQATVGVFGLLGVAGLAFAAAAALRAALDRASRRAAPPLAPALPAHLTAAFALAIGLVVVLYLRLPHDEAYLIPALPFTLALLSAWTPRTPFRIALGFILLAPFLLGIDVVPPKKGVAPLRYSPLAIEGRIAHERAIIEPTRGPLLMDHDKRTRMMALVRETLPALDRMPAGGLLLAGNLNPVLFYYQPEDPAHIRYLDMLPRARVDERLRRGESVYYLPDVRSRTIRMLGYDLRDTGARELFPGQDGAEGRPGAAR